MTLLQDTEWEEPLLEPRHDRDLERWAKKRMGMVPDGLGYLAACPDIVKMYYELDFAPLIHVDRDLAGLVGLVVSQDNFCRYCYAGVRLLLTLSGMAEEDIRKLEHALQTARYDSQIQPALDFARRISRANPLPSAPERKTLVEAGYDEDAIKELAFAAARIVLANRMATLPALPPKRVERMAGSQLVRLLRPLIAWRLRPLLHEMTGKPERLSDELKRGPYSDLVVALDGLPAARTLRTALDAVWSSPHTTSRAKALVFAVVARGLDCRHSEREAFRLLGEEGLAPERVERILADLAGPELDPVEALGVPYARETLWYEPGPIQRRGRELLERLTAEQFVEIVGVASLANMICRLGVVLDEP